MGFGSRRAVGAAAALSALLLAGCTTGVDAEPNPAASAAPASGDSTSSTAQLPDSPIGRQAQWAIDELARDAGPTAEVAGERFAEEFLAEVAADDVSTVFDQLRPLGPWQVADVETAGTEAVVGLRNGAGQPWRMIMALDADDAIATLVIQPDSDTGVEAPAATTWTAVQDRLGALDAGVGMLAARVTDSGQCEPISQIESGEARPIASIFKLYVLDALATAVTDGHVNWNDQLTITDDVRSLPTGELQNEAAGTRVPVSEAAAKMIAISDNTGADLLTDLVGRDAVHAAMAGSGHGDPALNQPFLTTRELFFVGWGPGGLREQWHDADAAGRERILADLPAGTLPLTASDVGDPVWQLGVGWFASPVDICAAMVALHDEPNSTTDQQLREILGRNRGVNIDPGAWPYVAFKGGSAPGVVTGSWYGERADGQRFVYVMLAAAPEAAAVSDHETFFQLAENAFDLLATQ